MTDPEQPREQQPPPPAAHPFSETPPPTALVPADAPPPSTLPSELEPRRRPGRPTRLTREVHEQIVGAIEQGSYVKIAAQAAGVGQSTLAGWLARGREAAAAAAQHEEDGLYCPTCDTNRTTEVRLLRDAQDREDARYAAAVEEWQRAQDDDDAPLPAEPPVQSHAVLDRCPSCGSDEYPDLWQLDDAEAPYLELLESVTGAQAEAEVAAVAAWRKAWGDDWRAARDYLARTAPERWAGVTRVQMTTEEAERRIDDAVNEALLAVGIDLPGGDELDRVLDEGGVLDA